MKMLLLAGVVLVGGMTAGCAGKRVRALEADLARARDYAQAYNDDLDAWGRELEWCMADKKKLADIFSRASALSREPARKDK